MSNKDPFRARENRVFPRRLSNGPTQSELFAQLREKAVKDACERQVNALKVLSEMHLEKESGNIIGRFYADSKEKSIRLSNYMVSVNINKASRIKDFITREGKQYTRYTISVDTILRLLKYAQQDPNITFQGKDLDKDILADFTVCLFTKRSDRWAGNW